MDVALGVLELVSATLLEAEMFSEFKIDALLAPAEFEEETLMGEMVGGNVAALMARLRAADEGMVEARGEAEDVEALDAARGFARVSTGVVLLVLIAE